MDMDPHDVLEAAPGAGLVRERSEARLNAVVAVTALTALWALYVMSGRG